MSKYIFSLLFLASALLSALSVTDSQGVTQDFSYEELAALPRQDVTTIREKEGVAKKDTWQGLRFDTWLQTRVDKPFKIMRFESDDRYMVSFSRAELDTLALWLVFSQDGRVFADSSMRLIVPGMRDMKWVRGLERVVLEDFDPLKLPARFEFLESRLQKEPLLQDPAPFVNIKAWYFADLLPSSARGKSCNVVLYSQDGMKLALEYPLHLEGAILEPTDEGFNLKSPQIPGGMWLKKIIYIQINDFALIHTGNLDALIALNRIMDWQLSPDVQFVIHKNGLTEKVPLNTLLSKPEMLADVESFELQR